MRRRIPIVVITLLLLSVPQWAQRGGHAGMGGAHGVGGAAHGGSYANYGHSGSGWGHSGSGWSGSGWGNGSGWNHDSGHSHYHYYYYGRYGYPWGWGWGYGYGYPVVSYGFWDTSPWYQSYDSYAYAPPPAYAYVSPDANGSAAYQQQQIDQLNQEVATLRARVATPPQNYAQRPQAEIHAQTVLVFRDHHKEEVANYAIVGKTLWIFNQQRARKVPISELDIAATTTANDDRGITFSVPEQ